MKTIMFIVSVALIAILLTGCTASRVETDYGTSYKLARFNQTLDLEAEKNIEPVEGMEGRTSEKIVESYQKGFEKPATTVTPVIIGAGGK